MTAIAAAAPLLEVSDVSVTFGKGMFGRPGRREVHALSGVSLDVKAGETLGIVGESGCGKSTLCRVMLRLIAPEQGAVRFEGRDLAAAKGEELRDLRRRVQAVFQDSGTSFNPRSRLHASLQAPLEVHGVGTARERDARIAEVVKAVGLDPAILERYPHQISGGQRQRVSIARALVLDPRVVILDEPVSSLDVAIQAQVLNLLRQLQRDLGLTYVFVSHNLAVVRHMCDRVAVMYLGEVVEQGPVRDIFAAPKHPYTRALLQAVPSPDPSRRGRVLNDLGELPQLVDLPSGCRFHPRCPVAMDACRTVHPLRVEVGPGHEAACLLHGGPTPG